MNVVEDAKGHVNELVNLIGYSMVTKYADKIEKVFPFAFFLLIVMFHTRNYICISLILITL